VQKLTKSLIDAYYLILKEEIAASPTSGAQKDHSLTMDYFLNDKHSSSNSTHPLNGSVSMPSWILKQCIFKNQHIVVEALLEAPSLNIPLHYHP
jgi:hypothetical protein